MSQPEPFDAVILAAQRDGRVDPLAEGHGVVNKSLVRIVGVALVRRVVDALLETPGLRTLRIVAEPAAFGPIAAVLPADPRIDFVTAADNLADSVYAAAKGLAGPVAITTADNVLLTAGAVRAVLTPLNRGADVTVAMATQAAVLTAHPLGQRRFYRFADDAYSNCNLYALGGASALKAAEGFRSGGQFAKKPLRMIMALGPINLALLLMGRLTLRGALQRVSRRFRLKVEPVILADGAHAIDVDNARTFGCAEALLLARQASDAVIAPRQKTTVEV